MSRSSSRASAPSDGVVVVGGPTAVLTARLREAQARRDVRCVVLALPGDDVDAPGDDLVVAVATSSVPVVATLHGHVAPATVAVALAADLRCCADDATIALDGLCGGTSATLPDVVGTAAARLLLLAPETLTAHRALAVGLVHALHPAPHLPTAAADLAGRVAATPAGTGAALRRALPSVDVVAAMEREQHLRDVVARHRP